MKVSSHELIIETNRKEKKENERSITENHHINMADRITHTHTKNWRQSNQKTKHKTAVLGSHLSISTLNVTGLNSPMKAYRVAKWI